RNKLIKWHSGVESITGKHTITEYRDTISRAPYNITKQTWYFEETDTNPTNYILVIVSEANGPDPRKAFVASLGNLETWCVAQLRAQKEPTSGTVDPSVYLDPLPILP